MHSKPYHAYHKRRTTMTVKILLDTDIGSDIDDAVCLAYLLAQPACELLGITTVSGEADKRAMLASVLCKIAHQQVPIFPGAEEPLLVPQGQTKAPQAKALEKWEHDTGFPHGHAVDFLRQTIHAYPGQVTLLTIGPLTNIALLFRLDPDIPYLLKGLVMMCGVFTGRFPDAKREWNALLDPHATAIVYKAPVGRHCSIGLDVTLQVEMKKQEVLERFALSPLLAPVIDFAQHWNSETIVFHDPLAATTIFDEHICQFTKGSVEIELTDPNLQGATYWQPNTDKSRHEVAFTVDTERFFNRYFSVFREE